MPVLSGYYVSNQKDIYKGMLRKNVMFDAGDFNKLTETKLIQKIEAILNKRQNSIYLFNLCILPSRNKQTIFLERYFYHFLNIYEIELIPFRKEQHMTKQENGGVTEQIGDYGQL